MAAAVPGIKKKVKRFNMIIGISDCRDPERTISVNLRTRQSEKILLSGPKGEGDSLSQLEIGRPERFWGDVFQGENRKRLFDALRFKPGVDVGFLEEDPAIELDMWKPLFHEPFNRSF
jgi:hypothetical protein